MLYVEKTTKRKFNKFDIFSNYEQVREAAESIRPGLLLQTCGSYRRGKATCGDCDILISHRDGVSHEHLLFPLVDKLKASGKEIFY